MLKVIFIVLLSCFAQPSFAAEQVCAKLSEQADSMDDYYRPSLEGKVIGSKKLYFYTAPNAQCKMKGVYVIKGDSLAVYKSYKDWLKVMYIAKDGEDYIAWVSSKQVKIIGQYGNNP
jgi:hypothetical protein